MSTFYYDPVYDACEPCFSSVGNQCVYMEQADPRNQDWIIDDDDVFPDSDDFPQIACGENQKFDKFMGKCRALCPGEGAGGQEFVYADGTHFGGKCECPDREHMSFDEESSTCVPIVAPTAGRLGYNPGDPFAACNLDSGEYLNCYFPDRGTCLETISNAEFAGDGGINVKGRMLAAQARSRACPYMMCSTTHSTMSKDEFAAPRTDCVCLTKTLGSGIMAGAAKKKIKLKKQ